MASRALVPRTETVRVKVGNGRRRGTRSRGIRLPLPRLPVPLSGGVLGHKLNHNAAAGGPVYRLNLRAIPGNITLAAGSVGTSYTIGTTNIESWSSWAALFNEFSVVGARLFPMALTSTNFGGFAIAVLDEKVSTASASDLDKPYLRLSLDANPSPDDYVVEWKASDLLDLQWTATGTATTPAWLKFFASPGSTFTSNANTSEIVVTGEFAVDFRGLK